MLDDPAPWSTRIDLARGATDIRTVRPTYSRRARDKIICAPASAKAIGRGEASLAALTHVVVHEIDHYRQSFRHAEMMAGQGFDLIGRSILTRWPGQTAHLLDPIVSRIRRVRPTADDEGGRRRESEGRFSRAIARGLK